MSAIQQVVDELRFIIQREFVEKTDEFVARVREYSDLCHEANSRLRRCDDFLKQGLKSEAVHLADAKPNLLDTIAVLDFPELDELNEVITLYLMTPPEPLLMDMASALNAAYTEGAPLQTLLDQHRLLALGRGPLSQRLAVLRSLADLDDAPHWIEDIREMELARFREVELESQAAAKSGSTATLKTLVDELQAVDWRETIPSSLVRTVRARASQTVRSNSRQQIEELNRKLHEAFSALDADAARPLREEWQRQRRTAQLDQNDPLIESVGPILQWLEDDDRRLAEEKEFAQLTYEVEQSLDDDDLSLDELQKLQRSVEHSGRALPSLLETRFRSKLDRFELHEGRRKKTLLGAGLAGFLAVASILGFVIYLAFENQRNSQQIAAISGLIDGGQLAEAHKLIDQHAANSTTESWMAVKKKLATADQAEHERLTNLDAELANIRESSDAIRITASLKRARDLVKTPEEKIELGRLDASWQKRVNEETAERERLFRELIAAATSSLKELDSLIGESDSARLTSQVNQTGATINQLIASRETVSKSLQTQSDLLESRWKLSQKLVADQKRREEILDRLNDAAVLPPGGLASASKAGKYEAILNEFVEALPDDSHTGLIKNAATMNPVPAVQALQKGIESWRSMRLTEASLVEARLKEVQSLMADHPQTPDLELLTQYDTWLTSILRRYEENGSSDDGAHNRLLALFNSKFIKSGHILRDDDGNTYYLAKERTDPFGDVASFTYLVGFNGETAQVSMKPTKLLTPQSVAPPQQELSAKVRASLKNITVENWREFFSDLTQKLIKADLIDPLLRYTLVSRTLEYAGRGDHFLELELAPIRAKLADNELDRSAPWIDPKSRSAATARGIARDLISNLPPVEPFFKAAALKQRQFEQALFAKRFSVGWLQKNRSGEWECRTKWVPDGEYGLYAAAPPDRNGQRKWLPVGRVKSDTWKLDAELASQLGELTLVFASSDGSSVDTQDSSQP